MSAVSSVVSNVATNASNNFIKNYNLNDKNIEDIKGKTLCKECLNPATVGQQFGGFLGLTYSGGDNPRKMDNKKADYSYIPSNLAEYPAIGHDRRYDNLEIAGASRLFTDTRAIGADWRFVSEELYIAANPFINPIDRATAAILGNGLAIAATPKTSYHFIKNRGFTKALLWYNYSNQGVINTPSIHKHK